VPQQGQSARHRFCPGCGAEATAGSSFCATCGAGLVNRGVAHSNNPNNQADTGKGLDEEGNDSIIPDVTWDFSDWDDAIQGDLGAALLRNKIPHRWEGTTLSTEPDYEDRVDAILDEFCGLPDQHLPAAEIESEEEDGGEVTWETPGWNSADRGNFASTLMTADIPHYWDGTTLVSDAQYENRIDSIMDALYGTLSEDGPPQNQPDANGYESDFPAGGSGGRAAWIVAAVFIVLGAGAIVFVAHHHSGSTSASAALAAGPGTPTNDSGSGSTIAGPTTAQLQQAYSIGYFYGQHLNGPESLCQTNRYSDPQLNAQYQNGCRAGYGGGSSSNAGNQGPSPTAPDVKPYSGGSYSGSVDPSSGGFPGAP
jgi:hypothetical protein